jgi:hypothetical protein
MQTALVGQCSPTVRGTGAEVKYNKYSYVNEYDNNSMEQNIS